MPVYPTSFFVPVSPSIPFLMEDIYFRGGFRVVADITARDAIPVGARKAGMWVVTADSNKMWQLQSDKITYNEIKTGGKDLTGVYPISILVNGDVSIDTKYLLPQTGAAGDFLVKDSGGNPAWQEVHFNGATGNRFSGTYTVDGQIDPMGHADFELNMSQTIMLLELKVDVPKLRLEAFATTARDEQNPYTFISTADLMEDNGISEMSDGSLFKGRRYNVLANLETPAKNIIYWRATNEAALPVKPTLTYTYLTLQ